MAQKMLMELTTDVPDRAKIKIDEVAYEIKSREDFGLKQDAEFRGVMADFTDAQPKGDWQRMAEMLDRMVRFVVIGIPDDVLAKLSDAKKLKIIEVFTKEVIGSRAPTSEAAAA